MTVEIKTKVGTFYLEKTPNGANYCKLLDSNKKWVVNIFRKYTAEKLEDIQELSELVDLGIADNVTWGNSLEDLANEINNLYEVDMTADELKDYDFLNKCGDTYFIIDFE